MSAGSDAPGPSDILAVDDLAKHYRVVTKGARGRHAVLRAVDGVSFTIGPQEALGLVGESGSGKSTTARLVLRLIDPDAGTVTFDGRDVTALGGPALRQIRRSMQAVFQDVSGSLNPRMTVEQIIAEPLAVHGLADRAERRTMVHQMLDSVGMSGAHLHRYPYELSGGQRQRVSVARALIVRPKLLVLDEPTSALDASTRERILGLLERLRGFGAAFFVVSHDLDFISRLCNRTAVMYLGRIMEIGSADQVHNAPRHPYSQALLDAVPKLDAAQRTVGRLMLSDDVPSPTAVPSGCRFHTRCPFAWERCRTEEPVLRRFADGGSAACHLHDDGPRLDGAPVTVLRERATGAGTTGAAAGATGAGATGAGASGRPGQAGPPALPPDVTEPAAQPAGSGG